MLSRRRHPTFSGALRVGGLVLLTSPCAVASGAQTLSVGVRGGPSLAGVLWEDPYATDAMAVRPAFHIGPTVRFGLSRWLDVEFDALWSRKGEIDGGGALIGSVTSDYLEFPVLARLHLPTRLAPHLVLGPTAAVQLRCWVDGVAGVGAGRCDDPFLGVDRTRMDWGVLFGLGVSHPVGSGSLVVDVLADLGLQDIKRDPLPPGYARNVAIHLSVGFSVPLSRTRERHR